MGKTNNEALTRARKNVRIKIAFITKNLIVFIKYCVILLWQIVRENVRYVAEHWRQRASLHAVIIYPPVPYAQPTARCSSRIAGSFILPVRIAAPIISSVSR